MQKDGGIIHNGGIVLASASGLLLLLRDDCHPPGVYHQTNHEHAYFQVEKKGCLLTKEEWPETSSSITGSRHLPGGTTPAMVAWSRSHWFTQLWP